MKAPHDTSEIQKLCIKNAIGFLADAKLLIEERKYRSAYLLLIFGLEEIGKAEMLFFHQQPTSDNEEDTIKGYDDHVKKILYALIDSIGDEALFNPKKFKEAIDFANKVHEHRLLSMYVDAENNNGKILKPTKNLTEKLLKIVEFKIKQISRRKPRQQDKEGSDLFNWFIEGFLSKEKRRFFLSEESKTKYEETRNFKKWIKWLKEEEDKVYEEALNIGLQEIRRGIPKDQMEAMKDKWKIKIPIYTNTHVIRPQALTLLNSHPIPIALYIAKDEKTAGTQKLNVEFVLPKKIPIQLLWQYGRQYCNFFIVALNISSKGFFWWQISNQTTKYYERIEDLENSKYVPILELTEKEAVSLGHTRQKLSQNDILWALKIFSGIQTEKYHDFFMAYLTGLSLLGKHDIYMDFSNGAFNGFFNALVKIFEIFSGSPDRNKVVSFFQQNIFPLMEEEKISEITLILDSGFNNEIITPNMKVGRRIEDVGILKLLVDLYYCFYAHQFVESMKHETDFSIEQ